MSEMAFLLLLLNVLHANGERLIVDSCSCWVKSSPYAALLSFSLPPLWGLLHTDWGERSGVPSKSLSPGPHPLDWPAHSCFIRREPGCFLDG